MAIALAAGEPDPLITANEFEVIETAVYFTQLRTAVTFPCFLLAALMSYIPPQRQQIYINLRIPYPGAARQKFSFDSEEQGKREDRKDITFLDLFEENSTTKVQNEENPLAPAEFSGYLYREADLWHIHLFPDKYEDFRC